MAELQLDDVIAGDEFEDGDDQKESAGSDAKHEVLLSLQCSLYRFHKASNQWVTRGKGSLKLLRSMQTGLIRILLRDEKTLLLRLNHYILSDLQLQPNPGSDRSWTWTSQDFTEPEDPQQYTFAARFLSSEDALEFKTVYDLAREEHREAVAAWKLRSQQGPAPQGQDIEIGEKGQALAEVFRSLNLTGTLPLAQMSEDLFYNWHPAAFRAQLSQEKQQQLALPDPGTFDPAAEHPAALTPTVTEARQLWGGAFRCTLDSRFVDVSLYRTVPDYQEVYSDADTDQSVVFELLQLHQRASGQAAESSRQAGSAAPAAADEGQADDEHWLVQLCFEDLGKANNALQMSVGSLRTEALATALPELHQALVHRWPALIEKQLTAEILHGHQIVGKYRDTTLDQSNTVHMVLVAVRLEHLLTDLLISFNFPVKVSAKSSAGELKVASPEQIAAVVGQVLGSFEAVHWDIFGGQKEP